MLLCCISSCLGRQFCSEFRKRCQFEDQLFSSCTTSQCMQSRVKQNGTENEGIVFFILTNFRFFFFFFFKYIIISIRFCYKFVPPKQLGKQNLIFTITRTFFQQIHAIPMNVNRSCNQGKQITYLHMIVTNDFLGSNFWENR